MRAIAAIPAGGLLAGAAAGFLFPDTIEPLAVALLIVSLVAALWGWRASRPATIIAGVAVGFAAGGALLSSDAWYDAWRPSLRVAFEERARDERARTRAAGRAFTEDDQAFAIVTGILRADASRRESGVSLSVDVDGIVRSPDPSVRRPDPAGRPAAAIEPVRGGLLVTVAGSLGPSLIDEWRAGRRVRMPVQLRRPGRYLDPGVPDNERALARSGTTLVGTVKSGVLVEVIGPGTGWSESTAVVRRFARRAIDRSVGRWSAKSSAIVTAIVIGDRAGLDEEMERRLQEAGTYHVIAISGGNIAILAALLLAAFRVVASLGRIAMLAIAGFLVAYASVVGGGASVDRATLMAVVYFGARAIDQRSRPLNALSLVAAICVATRPLSIADPAFVLTCGATLGILLSQQSPLDPAESRRGGRVASSASSALHTALRSMFVASVAAEMVLLPIGALLFSRVTVAGLALNFLAIPLMATAQVAGMAVVPLTVASEPFAALAGAVAHAGATGLVWSADLVRFAPSTSWRVASPAWAILAWYYLAGIVGWSLWRRRAANLGSAESLLAGYLRRIAWAVTACAALAIVADPKAVLAARGDGRLHVTFLDVGQGDSALVRFPRGQTMLVDAGGVAGPSRFDIGDRVVGAFLRHSRVRHLDYVVLTHGDLDHVDGAEAILRDFRPSEVWEGIPVLPFGPLTALRAQAAASGSRWANVYRGDRLLIDGVEVVALHPEPGDWERQRVRNDDSIVLDIRWGDVSVLLTGDIGRDVERAIDTAPARLRVLKVPHHGSLTSSSAEFVRAMDPKVAVFSAGRANAFGHPAPAVLQRYRAAGAAIFRTDQDGAVSLTTDGHSIDVSTFTGRRLKLPAMAYHEGTKNTKDREERIHDNAQNRLHAAP